MCGKCERCNIENRGVIYRLYKWFIPGEGEKTFNIRLCIKCDRNYKHQRETTS